MGSYQSVFKRYEKKYLLNEDQYQLLQIGIENKVRLDKFSQSTIGNVYFDTEDYRLIRNSMEKPLYKEKLRIRSYGTPHEQDKVFVELKKKYKGVVYKRRTEMSLEQAREYLYEGVPVNNSSQIIKEIDWFIKYYEGLKPSLYISYHRLAQYGVEDPGLRITFDTNILWRDDELDLGNGAWGRSLLAPGQCLMEIKMSGAMPLWLSHLLAELKIYPTSFSKYGKAYMSLLSLQSFNKGGKTIA